MFSCVCLCVFLCLITHLSVFSVWVNGGSFMLHWSEIHFTEANTLQQMN